MDTYEDINLSAARNLIKESETSPDPARETSILEEETVPSPDHPAVTDSEAKGSYKRTLSGGLQSPRADVPKSAILQRINSKKSAKSYQLGHQLSLKWSTGAGPRIGCVADYPIEVRQQALEFVNLSPRLPPTPSSFRLWPTTPSPRGKDLDSCNDLANAST